jgi:hypothetical protein
MANCKFVWTPVGGSQQSYVPPVNFSFGYESPEQEAMDLGRAIDGTLRSYVRELKQKWVLPFKYVLKAQRDQFKTIKDAQVDLDFYWSADDPEPTCTGLWTNDFNFVLAAPGLWSGTIELQEI